MQNKLKKEQELEISKIIDTKIPRNKLNSSQILTKTKPVNKKDDGANLYNRIMVQERKKEYLLSVIRSQKEHDELKTIQDKPTLSANSKKIIKEQFQNTQPLYTRVDDVIAERYYQIDNLKRQIRNASAENLVSNNYSPRSNINSTKNNITEMNPINTTNFNIPTNLINNTNILNSISNVGEKNVRTNSSDLQCSTKQGFENWLKMNQRWAMEKDYNKKTEMRKKIIDNLKDHTFHPEISQKSIEIIKSKKEIKGTDTEENKYTNESFYDRLMLKKIEKENNLNMLRNENHYPFHPSISTKIPNYLAVHYEKRNRLGSVGASPKKPKYVSPHSKKMENVKMNKSQEIDRKLVNANNPIPIYKKPKKKKWEDIIDDINNVKLKDSTVTVVGYNTKNSRKFSREESKKMSDKEYEAKESRLSGFSFYKEDDKKLSTKEAKNVYQVDVNNSSKMEKDNKKEQLKVNTLIFD